MKSATSPIVEMASNIASNTEVQDASSRENDVIIGYLKNIEARLGNVEVKLGKLDVLEQKVDKFEKDIKNLWLHIHDNTKVTEQKINTVGDRLDHIELSGPESLFKIQQLE